MLLHSKSFENKILFLNEKYIMNGNINLKVVDEIINSFEELEYDEEKEDISPDENYLEYKSYDEEVDDIENEEYSYIDKLSKYIDK